MSLRENIVDRRECQLLENRERHPLWIVQVENVDQMMGHTATLGHGRFCHADVHAPVEVAGVGIDDLTVE